VGSSRLGERDQRPRAACPVKRRRPTLQRYSATVNWDAPDGDREKTILMCEGGRWKAWLTMPKVKQP
jgi:hypothetical protein